MSRTNLVVNDENFVESGDEAHDAKRSRTAEDRPADAQGLISSQAHAMGSP